MVESRGSRLAIGAASAVAGLGVAQAEGVIGFGDAIAANQAVQSPNHVRNVEVSPGLPKYGGTLVLDRTGQLTPKINAPNLDTDSEGTNNSLGVTQRTGAHLSQDELNKKYPYNTALVGRYNIWSPSKKHPKIHGWLDTVKVSGKDSLKSYWRFRLYNGAKFKELVVIKNPSGAKLKKSYPELTKKTKTGGYYLDKTDKTIGAIFYAK